MRGRLRSHRCILSTAAIVQLSFPLLESLGKDMEFCLLYFSKVVEVQLLLLGVLVKSMVFVCYDNVS